MGNERKRTPAQTISLLGTEVFSFNNVCETLGLSPQALKKRTEAMENHQMEAPILPRFLNSWMNTRLLPRAAV